jgi:long-chain acyl-CoA synthetase
MTTLPTDALEEQSKTNPDKTAFVYGGDVWTYEVLAAESERLARGLLSQGIKTGDRVVLHMLNRPEMIIAYYACFHIGAIVMPLRTAYKAAELKPILQRVQPSLYLGETDLYQQVAAIDPSILPGDKRIIVNAGGEALGSQRWFKLLERSDKVQTFTLPDIHAPAVLISTSGTTGVPKLVVHTQATLAESAEAFQHLRLDGSHRAVECLSMAHAGGLFTVLAYVRFGVPFVLLNGFDADAVLDVIEGHGTTWLIAMTGMMAELLLRQKARPRKMDSLRFCVTGGDVCPAWVQAAFASHFGVPLHILWAASETFDSLTCGVKPGSALRIVNDAQVRLVDEHGVPVPKGKDGELLVRGPGVSPGYWAGPGKIEGAPQDGWYRTGDIMRQDLKGGLWFVSRKKDIIIRGGTNISPVEVERALVDAHPAIKEAAVVGVPDDVLGERVAGFVQLVKGTQQVALEQVLATLRARLAEYKVPEHLKIIDVIPRNELGKVDRKKLVSMIQIAPTTGGFN